jgi:XTP/dITP diphosphohydrolase
MEVEAGRRKARFRTIAAYANGSKVVTFEGICEGEIINSPRGEKGFGYDPVFVPEGYKVTFAELSEQEKNVLSHRGKALKKFRDWLKRGEY